MFQKTFERTVEKTENMFNMQICSLRQESGSFVLEVNERGVDERDFLFNN